jgi:hypothetical protein
MAATGDPSVLSAGAKAFASLASYDADNTQSNLTCPEPTEEEKLAEEQALAAKTGELLDGLAAAGESLVSDPQAVKQVMLRLAKENVKGRIWLIMHICRRQHIHTCVCMDGAPCIHLHKLRSVALSMS